MGTKSGEDRIIRMGKNKKFSEAPYSTFTSIKYEFTNCGAEGMYGPTLAHCIYNYNNPSSTDKQDVAWNTGGVITGRDLGDLNGGNAHLSIDSNGHLIRDWSNNLWDSVASSAQVFSGASVFQFSIVANATYCNIGIIKPNFYGNGLKPGTTELDYIGHPVRSK